MSVSEVVRAMTEEVIGGPPFAVGDTVIDPQGRTVKIVSGQYWGEHGLSNFWRWREVLPNGELGKIEHGYGWHTGGGIAVSVMGSF